MEKTEKKESNKLTYEQLMQLASQQNTELNRLRQTANQLKMQIDAYQMQDFYKRLEWLWTVISCDNPGLFPQDFIDAKRDEFMEMMTPAEPEVGSDETGTEN